MAQRSFLPEMQAIAQVFAYAYASRGDDKAAVANHLITLRASRAHWQVQSSNEKSKIQWWNNTHSLTALHSVLASFNLASLGDGGADATSAGHDHGSSNMAATASGTMQMKSSRPNTGVQIQPSGYPLYNYQLDALGTLQPPSLSRQIARVPPTITADDLYTNYISVGRPVVIGKGLLDSWGAQKQWRLQALIQTRGEIMLTVARGPKPGINEWDKHPGDDEEDGDETVNTQPDIIAGQVSSLTKKDELADAQRRWDFFMKDIKDKVAEGHIFNEQEMTLTKPPEMGGKTLTLMPPPKPGLIKAGAKNNLGKPVKMSLSDYISQIMAPNPDGSQEGKHIMARNVTHPEDRYVFNTMQDGLLANDFVVPDLIEQISTSGKYAGSFKDCHHGPGTFEFFIGGAGSGAYLHAHPAAWNGLVFGRKRWVVLGPGKMQDNDKLPGGYELTCVARWFCFPFIFAVWGGRGYSTVP